MTESWTDLGTPLKSSYPSKDQFSSYADKAFGAGKWKMTGGFRTDAREDQLRAQGRGTVAPGHTSHHSLGDANAPGAYDVAVPGMNPAQIGVKLKAAGWRGSEFPEGDHLHTNAPETWTDLGSPSSQSAPAPAKPAAPAPAAPPPKGETSYVKNLGRREGENVSSILQAQMDPFNLLAQIKGVGAAVGLVTAPVEAAGESAANYEAQHPKSPLGRLDSAVGLRPEKITPQEAERAGDIFGLLAPVPGVGKAAKGVEKLAEVGEELRGVDKAAKAGDAALKAREADMHSFRLDRMKKYGFEPTKGMAKGREARIKEIAREKDSLAQTFHVKQAAKAEESFQRAKYNYDLEPLKGVTSVRGLPKGYQYSRAEPIGHEGVDRTYKMINSVFDRVLPKVKMQTDSKLDSALEALNGRIEALRNPEASRVFRSLDTSIRQQLGNPGERITLDGKAFKQMESDLTKDMQTFYKAGHWREAEIVNDYLGALRENMVRHSPAKVAADVTHLNRAYARWSKTASAAARDPTSLGRFGTDDLLHVTKQEASSGAHGFARGQVPGQEFATTAHEIMHPSPLVPERAEAAHTFASKHGAITGAIRKVARPVASGAAEARQGAGARAIRHNEYLERTGQQGVRSHALADIGKVAAIKAAQAASQRRKRDDDQ